MPAPVPVYTKAAAAREAERLLRRGYWVRIEHRPDDVRKYLVVSEDPMLVELMTKEPGAGVTASRES